MSLPELIRVSDVEGEARVLDTDLAARLGFSQPRDVRKIIARHRGALSQMGPLTEIEEIVGKGQRAQTFYLNRKQAIFITAKSETEKATDITIEIIERFEAYENGHKADPMVALNDPATLRTLLLENVEKVLALQAENAALSPKAEGFDQIANADGLYSLNSAAKILGQPPMKFNQMGNSKNWWFRRAGRWCAYSEKVKAGLLFVKVSRFTKPDGSEAVSETIFITPLGLTKLSTSLRLI